MYVADSPIVSVPWDDPADEETKVGVFVNVSLNELFEFESFLTLKSAKFKLVSIVFPLFWTTKVYTIVSPMSTFPFELLSVTVAVFVSSIDGLSVIKVSVGSLTVFPSLSIPSSEVSDTLLLFPGLLAVATAVLITLGVFATFELII